MPPLQVQIGPCKFSSFCDKMLTFSENNTKILMNFRQNFPQRIKNGANIGPHGIAPRPVILWIEQGGKPKMHSLNFLCHNEPCKTPWDDFFFSPVCKCAGFHHLHQTHSEQLQPGLSSRSPQQGDRPTDSFLEHVQQSHRSCVARQQPITGDLHFCSALGGIEGRRRRCHDSDDKPTLDRRCGWRYDGARCCGEESHVLNSLLFVSGRSRISPKFTKAIEMQSRGAAIKEAKWHFDY